MEDNKQNNKNMTKCKSCGAEIAKSAKSCPSCGAKNKKPFYKTVWFWILIFIVFIIVVVEAVSGSSEPKAVNENSNAKLSSVTTEEKTSFGIGETANLDNANVTVNNMKKSSGSTYSKPKNGYEFVIVEVTITNTGDTNITYNPYDFSMKNSQGNITNLTFMTFDRDTALESGELAPGGTVTGVIPFEQPKDDSGLVLLYEGSLWSSSQLQFNLQ